MVLGRVDRFHTHAPSKKECSRNHEGGKELGWTIQPVHAPIPLSGAGPPPLHSSCDWGGRRLEWHMSVKRQTSRPSQQSTRHPRPVLQEGVCGGNVPSQVGDSKGEINIRRLGHFKRPLWVHSVDCRRREDNRRVIDQTAHSSDG